MWTKRKRRQMTYLHRGRNGNVDKWHKLETKLKRWPMSYLQWRRNGNVDKFHTYRRERYRNVDKCHTYRRELNRNIEKCQTCNVDGTETSTNVILKMWTKRKRRQMTYLHRGRNGNVDKCHTYRRERNGNIEQCQTCNVVERETLTIVILTDLNETETSTNVILTMWTKRKRRQMSNLQCGWNWNVDKWHTYNGDETKTSTNGILTI